MLNFLKNIINKLFNFNKAKRLNIKAGCKQDLPDVRDFKKQLPTITCAHPKMFSLRKYIPGGILNQRQTSACTGYAGAYAMSILINRQMELTQKTYKFKHVSPTYIYYNARKCEGFDTKVDDGSSLRSIMKALLDPGAIDISEMNESYNVTKEPPAITKTLPKYNISSYSRIEQNDKTIEIMQRTLDIEHLPIVCGIMLYEDLMYKAYYNGGIFDYTDITDDKCVGGHAVCICGYKTINDKLYFEIVNSWGGLQGENGFNYLPAETVLTDNVFDIWTLNKKYF